jgi:hypothetical protein
MADPITPNAAKVDGQVVTIWCSVTAGGAGNVVTVNLPTYAPKIDTRIGHPILNGMFVTDETNVTGSEVLLPSAEMARGTAPDSTGEWQITDIDTITFYQTADQNGFLGLTYIAYGVQNA